ncbi:PAS domain S-box protein [Zunongwangia sp.]|uniref:PAS domain S-box protein n=1 Tax=Zunongwangia sp. TaxID=1965325 RepID=UPI003AA9D021
MSIESSKYQILYVYTDKNDLSSFIMLQKEAKINFTVHYSSNFELIKEKYTNSNINLIFLDIAKISTFSKIKNYFDKIIKLFPKLPVIGLSGSSNMEIGIKCLNFGIYDFFYKKHFDAFSLYKILNHELQKQKGISNLKYSWQNYQQLFELSPQSMFVFDIDTLSFLDINNAAIKKYGYTRKEFLNMTLLDIRPTETIQKFLDIIENNKTDISNKFEGLSEHIDKMGNRLTVEINSNLINFNGRMVRISLANDVTEYLKKVSAIKKQNQLLQDISWLQSHKLRAPLVRIMELINDSKQSNPITDQFYLDEIQKASVELDKIIRTISSKASEAKYSVNETSR